MHSNPRSRRNVRARLRRLLPRGTAADGVEVESSILGGFDGHPQILA
jgi:hypothetical protein